MIEIICADVSRFHDVWKLRMKLLEVEAAAHPPLMNGVDHVFWGTAMIQTMGWLVDQGSTVFLAMDGVDSVGYMVLSLGSINGISREVCVRSDGFYVLPEYRPMGVAGMLWRMAGKTLERLGAEVVQAMVLTGNTEACNLFAEHGFQPVAVLYERRLTHDWWRRQEKGS